MIDIIKCFREVQRGHLSALSCVNRGGDIVLCIEFVRWGRPVWHKLLLDIVQEVISYQYHELYSRSMLGSLVCSWLGRVWSLSY